MIEYAEPELLVRRFNAQKKTSILLVEQNARAALSIAEYGHIMENGKVVLDDLLTSFGKTKMSESSTWD